MKKTILKKALQKSVDKLFINQPNIFIFAPQTGPTEWNLSHHLANEIYKHFSEFDCDLDVTKRNFENKRPDIILHKRNSHHSNFLVIEVKRDGNQTSIKRDIQKVKSDWFSEPLKYQFGAVINLKRNKTSDIKVFGNTSSVS